MRKIWKDVPNYEGLYQVSNLGRVKSNHNGKGHKPKVLTNIPRNGYVSVILCKNKSQKNVFVHRLVAKCFVPNPENKPCVNHIDGNKSNPCAYNLEWCTQKENISHAIKNGLFNPKENPSIKKSRKGERATNPIYQFDKNGNFIKKWDSCRDICDYLGVKDSHIYDCISGKCRSAYGFAWSKIPTMSTGKITNAKRNKSGGRKGTKVNQYDLDGNFIRSFSSQKDASNSTKANQSGISFCCKGKTKTSGGFIWKYAEGE